MHECIVTSHLGAVYVGNCIMCTYTPMPENAHNYIASMSSCIICIQGWNFTDASLTSVYDENGCNEETVHVYPSEKWKMLKSAVETLGQLHLYCGDDILANQEDTDNGPRSIRSFWAWRVSHWGYFSCTLTFPFTLLYTL